MTEEDIKDRQLNAIVGAAVRALADSGADDEAIGAFAASHRVKVARILGHPEEALQPPDLQTIVQQAVSLALEQAGLGTRKSAGKTTQRFNVEIAGHRTSISIDKGVIAKLSEAKGSKKAVNKFVQQIAYNVPTGIENRSGWIEERIHAFLNFGAGEESAPAAPRH